MENLHDIFNQYVETGKYPGVQWKIIQNNSINAGLVGYKNLEKASKLLDDSDKNDFLSYINNKTFFNRKLKINYNFHSNKYL